MESCKQIIDQANIVQDLHLVRKKESGGTEGTGPHKVKLISDKVGKGRDYKTKKEIFVVNLLVEEDGQQKKYTFPVKNEAEEVHYLVKKFAEFKPGDEVVMEYKRDGMTGYIDVVPVKEKTDVEPSTTEDSDIPIIEEDAGDPPPGLFE